MKPLARPSRIPLWIALLGTIVCSATVTSVGWSDPGNERDASVQQSANPASSAGMYALQALIDFDSLEGAQFDPATGMLTLFGRRLRPDRRLRVAYLDLLAAALEANSPTFSLRWTPASQREVEESKQNQNGFFNIFDSTHHLNVLGAWLFRQGGIKVDPGIDFDSLGKKVNQAGGLERVFANHGPIVVPPEIVPLAFATQPHMTLEVKGMPPRSLLAQIALEADVQAKYLAELPQLKTQVPGYETYSQWERDKGSVEGEQHTWIMPDNFEIRESEDGQTLRFGKTSVRFRMEKYVAGQSAADPILSGYADMLTRNYDILAEKFPALHQIRECYKILSVADWLKRHGWRIALPRTGRIDWEPPTEVTGIVTMEVNVLPSDSGLRIKSVMWITGGVDLRVGDNSSVVRLPNLERLPVISPVAETNEQIRRIVGQKTEVPLPEIPGWVGQAKGGQEARKYVAIRANQVPGAANSAEIQEQLELLRRKAQLLAYYDNLINMSTRERGNALPELTRLAEEAKQKRTEYELEIFQTLTSVAVCGDELRLATAPLVPRRSTTEASKTLKVLDDVRGLLQDAQTSLQRKSSPPEYWTAVSKRFTDLAIEFENQMNLTSPKTWIYAEDIATHRSLVASIGFGLYQLGMKTLDLQEALNTTRDLDQQMGTAATDAARIQKRRQECFDDYRRERAKLEAMMRAR